MTKCIATSLLFILSVLLTELSHAQESDTTFIKKHFTTITKSGEYRHYKNVKELNRVAAYLKSVFESYSDTVWYQSFEVDGRKYKNVICSFGPITAKRTIIGAHYDVCGISEGADDNASGVVGLLELARMLQGKELSKRVDLVAYTLEEPPYYGTQNMGSFIHAQSLVKDSVEVEIMVSLEMIAYFKDQKNTQDYPAKFLSLFYGKRGNYITLVQKIGGHSSVDKWCRKYKRKAKVRTKRFKGPESLVGIAFSDHRNYWHFNIPALMITDTAFFRNKHYHQSTDVMENLDFHRMSLVINAVYEMLTD
ncbi:M28 family peptidase [Lishizhenia tianjinensis]|nr:M28 family peptidase [Lishizhenia tianjinensis]